MRRRPRKKRTSTGTCWMQGCGKEANGSRGLCSACYSSVRTTSADRDEHWKEDRRARLNLYLFRLDALDTGLIKIEHIKETSRAHVQNRGDRKRRAARNVRPSLQGRRRESGARRSSGRKTLAAVAPQGSKAIH